MLRLPKGNKKDELSTRVRRELEGNVGGLFTLFEYFISYSKDCVAFLKLQPGVDLSVGSFFFSVVSTTEGLPECFGESFPERFTPFLKVYIKILHISVFILFEYVRSGVELM
jgi:hypothetical protein